MKRKHAAMAACHPLMPYNRAAQRSASVVGVLAGPLDAVGGPADCFEISDKLSGHLRILDGRLWGDCEVGGMDCIVSKSAKISHEKHSTTVDSLILFELPNSLKRESLVPELVTEQ